VTDEQIIRALDYCVEQGITSECEKCKLKKGCRTEMITMALSLINRQKAEMERLTEEVEIKSQKRANIFEISSAYERGRAEAITKYHEEVKKRCIEGGIYPVIVKNIMEDARKEMVGEQ
jgi:hypothetical protein